MPFPFVSLATFHFEAEKPRSAHPNGHYLSFSPEPAPCNPPAPSGCTIESSMQRKMFWIIFALLGLIADFELPIWLSLVATIPIGVLSWWIAYRSDWF